MAASLVASGSELGWTAATQRHSAALVFIAFAFPLQLVASIIAFQARDGAAGTALGVLSATWLVTGLSWITTPPHSVSGSLGLLLLASAGLLAAGGTAAATGKLMPAAVFLVEAIRFALIGIHELGAPKVWQHAGGIVGLVVVGLAGYSMLAAVLEDARGHDVLPLLRRKPAPAEPGVREQL